MEDRKRMLLKALKAAFPHNIPVIAGFTFLGIAYGVLMSTKGYGPLWSFLMSAIAFCGSMQFVAINLLVVSFDPVQAFFMALMVNARHLFYGLSLLKKYKGTGKLKFFLIYWLCDETFSITYSFDPPKDVEPKWFYFFISLINYAHWILCSVIGGLIGHLITFDTKGIDFSLTALFVVIFINGWKEAKNRVPGIIGMACSVVSIMIFGTGNFIIPAMIMLLIVLTLGRGKLEKTQFVNQIDEEARSINETGQMEPLTDCK